MSEAVTESTVVVPTHEDFYEDRLRRVHRSLDDSWRHGSHVYEIYHRKEDGTCWMVQYDKSGDGETNGLRDGTCEIVQVKPVTKTVVQTTYEAVK